jgi:toxin ParE1/3/4
MPSKPRALRLSASARQDLDAIWLYTLHKWSLVQADGYVGALLSACEDLAAGTKIGLNANHIREGYWRYLIGSHSIYFRISEANIDVTRILHQSMDVDGHLGEN